MEKVRDEIVATSLEQSRNFNEMIVVRNLPVLAVDQARSKINTRDSNSITTYAIQSQSAVSSAADRLLDSVRMRDVGPVADSLNQIVLTIRGLDTASLQKKQGMLSKFFGRATPIVNFLTSYETAKSQIETVIDHLETHRTTISRSVSELDLLYRETEEKVMTLEVDIAALRLTMEEYAETVLPIMKERAECRETPMASQEYSDARAFYDRMDRKYINLCTTRQVALQDLPSIRLTQENDIALLEKIIDIEVNTVPIWKRQLAMALESAKTAGAGRAITVATELTNQMLIAGAEQLGQAQIKARATVERGIIDVEAVEQANITLINTLTDIQSMVVIARTARRDAEQRIAQSETELITAITAN